MVQRQLSSLFFYNLLSLTFDIGLSFAGYLVQRKVTAVVISFNTEKHECMGLIYDLDCFSPVFKTDVVHAVAKSVEALLYKSEGRGFDSRWCH